MHTLANEMKIKDKDNNYISLQILYEGENGRESILHKSGKIIAMATIDSILKINWMSNYLLKYHCFIRELSNCWLSYWV